jgi:16S rRNA (cytosine1402-N4)-methyltransferase
MVNRSASNELPHSSVLLEEAVQYLAIERGGLFIDATLGLGGHTEAILKSSERTRVIGIDRDSQALKRAEARLAVFNDRFRALHGDYREIDQLLSSEELTGINGILVDLGISSMQLDSPERGFSFRHKAPLDMRMDPSGDDETAAKLLERLSEKELADVIFNFGEEPKARRIARWIVNRRRENNPVLTTDDLADLVARAVGYRKGQAIHPATRTFQALRIAVNRELEGLDQFIETCLTLLQPEGRFVAISFHSLEDRIVKRTLRLLSGRCECGPRVIGCFCGARRLVEILTPKPIVPSPAELNLNPRARSAKLRACLKLPVLH